jgi:hypothetical protein
MCESASPSPISKPSARSGIAYALYKMQLPEVSETDVHGTYKTCPAAKEIESDINPAELSIFPTKVARTESVVNWIAVHPSVPFVWLAVLFTYAEPFDPMLLFTLIADIPMIIMWFVKYLHRTSSSDKC